ncbi:FtsK/SpoIIIE family DNA translocase [Thermohalobacter berrensis]|uniref:Cell division protein FtsK n=1 Tax=Thermohalobacter berrensis TaxID=99594 RepID=A0A419TAK2_9FIRM|nr:DNA translocase FtsK [Thermohalobacter berrensis]RKD34491.1 cell division protein FtsK [Thermohalobacter berrensis]
MAKFKKKSKRKRKKNRNKEINKEVVGISIISAGILALVSMHSQSTGFIGIIIRNKFMELAGIGGYIIPYLILLTGILVILDRLDLYKSNKVVNLFIIFSGILTIMHIRLFPDNLEINFIDKVKLSIEYGKEALGGGLIGAIFSHGLLRLFGKIGSYIIVLSAILISFLVFTGISIVDILKNISMRLVEILKIGFEAVKEFIYIDTENNQKKDKPKKKKRKNKNQLENKDETNTELDEKIKILDFTKDINKNEDTDNKENTEINFQKINKSDSKISKESKKEASITSIQIVNEGNMENYELPNLELLDKTEKKSNKNEKKHILNNAKKLEQTFSNFGIKAKVIQISKGPTITRYELQPAPGVKVSKIVNLADDIALSLAASDIRIEAPIPGKSAIGIEVPNKEKLTVSLREVLESKEYMNIDSKIPFALGKDIAGQSMVANIEKMPHLLIAGATGSGKSVCINTLITSILYKARPNEVKLLMIDPKVVELSIYNGIPHLLIPVVTDPRKAASALNWAVQEMTRRYKLFADNGVRDISSFNSNIASNSDVERLPQIVLIIDELADLMMVSPGEVEDSICRLAQMARAAGIHLIIATQRPSVDVITGTIKANIPSRISFAVSSLADSRTILDMGGAEKLLGKGDMLYYPVGASKPKRIQGAFISEKEVEKIVNFLKAQGNTKYEEEVIDNIEKNVNTDNEDCDELLSKAIELVVEEGQASISYLQRKLRIGYARAARLMDEMEERGIVGGHEGSKPRKVLVTKEDIGIS